MISSEEAAATTLWCLFRDRQNVLTGHLSYKRRHSWCHGRLLTLMSPMCRKSPAPFLVTQQVHPRSTARSPRTRMSLAHGGYHFDRAVAHAIWEWPVMGWQLKPCLLIYPEVPQGQQLQDILHTLHVIKNTALPSFWIFGPGQKVLKLVYFQNLFLTHTTFPAITFVSLFHRPFAPLKQNHNHFNSQGLVPL